MARGKRQYEALFLAKVFQLGLKHIVNSLRAVIVHEDMDEESCCRKIPKYSPV